MKNIDRQSNAGKNILRKNQSAELTVAELLQLNDKMQKAIKEGTVMETISYIYNLGVATGTMIK